MASGRPPRSGRSSFQPWPWPRRLQVGVPPTAGGTHPSYVARSWRGRFTPARFRSATLVSDELQQRSVRVAEVDAAPLAACADPLHRTELDLDPAALEVGLGFLRRPRPG